MEQMDDNESLELFNWHAFKQPIPKEEGFTDLSRDVVKYCKGLPLAVEVIGSLLSTRRRKAEWKSVLEKLKLGLNDKDKVLEVLRRSFDDLDDNEKEIFLNIASVLIGMDKDDVIQTLTDSGYFANIGISNLENKSLITVNSDNRIGMHDLIQEMGSEITREQSEGMAEGVTCESQVSIKVQVSTVDALCIYQWVNTQRRTGKQHSEK